LGISLWGRKSEEFCVRPYALHRQQPKEDKQNFDFPPLEKFLLTPMASMDGLIAKEKIL